MTSHWLCIRIAMDIKAQVLFSNLFYWSIVDLQYCVNFCCCDSVIYIYIHASYIHARWFSYTHIYYTHTHIYILVAKSCLLQHHRLYPARLPCPWNFPGKNIGVGWHFLLQEIFLTEGLNLCLLHWQMDSLPLSHQGRYMYICIYVCVCIYVYEVKFAQSYPTVCDPMDYTVHGILQARILDWVAFPFSRRSSQPRDLTQVPALQMYSLPDEPQGRYIYTYMHSSRCKLLL